jgi:hypothetical protein
MSRNPENERSPKKYGQEVHSGRAPGPPRSRREAAGQRRVGPRRERTEKETSRRGFIREGGTEEQFELAWPSLRDRARHQRGLYRNRATREPQRAFAGRAESREALRISSR